jgi:hypothetical protein
MSELLEITKLVTLSTSHVSKQTCDKLPRGHTDMDSTDDLPSWAPQFARDEGWLFHAYPVDTQRSS